MERIKKALERAREERSEQPGSPLKTMREALVAQPEPKQPEQTPADAAWAQPKIPSDPPSSSALKAEPVAEVVEPVVEPVAEVAEPVVEPVAEAVEPVVEVVESAAVPIQAAEIVQSVVPESAVESKESSAKVQPREKRSKGGVSHQKSAVPSEIEYSQTRRVEISADLLESKRVIAGIKDHPQSDLFRVLRTKILHRMRVVNINSLAVTSPTKGAGKSMIAANLAVSLAMEANQTVMLVDLDLRKPMISNYFGFDAQQGVSDYLLEGTELPELLFQPGIDRLVILPAGNPVPQSSELLSTPRMAHLVEDITNRYATRIVVFDLPPLLHLDDALIFLPQVKSSLLVVEEGVNTPAEIEQCLMLLEKSNMLGTVYNKARKSKQLPY